MSKRGLIANIAAIALLVGALGYYNFIDKATVSKAETGSRCPDFTAQTYKTEGDTFLLSEETFTLSKQSGKVCVVNFWETWCQACIEELPSFNQIQEEYEGQVEVIAIAGVTSTAESAAAWMSNKGWKAYDEQSEWTEFSLTIAYMPTANCVDLGCGGMLPRTLVVDKNGMVAHTQDGAMTHEALQEIIEELL